MHHSQIYTPIVFGDAALNVPSYRVKGHILVEMCVLCSRHFIGSKVIIIFVDILVCALTAAYFSGYLSCVRSAGHIS